jgi:hypothetical protein
MVSGLPTQTVAHNLLLAAHAWPSGVALFDASYRLQLANPGLRRILDLPETAAPLGIALDRFVDVLAARGEFVGPGEDMARERVAAVKVGAAMTTSRARPNGRWLEINHVPIPEGGLLLIYTDVTSRVERRWRNEQLVLELKTRVAELEALRK